MNPFDLHVYIKERRTEIDAALRNVIPRQTTGGPQTLHEALNYALFSGGKRLRPMLCLAAADAIRDTHDIVLPAAIAVELLHTYTLVHDDLPCMDNDDERRGQPTVHVKFGTAHAVLTGDALHALAFSSAASLSAPPPYPPGMLVQEIAKAAFQVVAGQIDDIEATGRPVDHATVYRVHERKTGALFSAAIRMGAIAVGSSPTELAALSLYAHYFGKAFQIADDLLDADAWAASDPAKRELNCLSIMSIEEARLTIKDCTARAVQALCDFPRSTAQALIALVRFAGQRTT